jgi:hypothetical protein
MHLRKLTSCLDSQFFANFFSFFHKNLFLRISVSRSSTCCLCSASCCYLAILLLLSFCCQVLLLNCIFIFCFDRDFLFLPRDLEFFFRLMLPLWGVVSVIGNRWAFLSLRTYFLSFRRFLRYHYVFQCLSHAKARSAFELPCPWNDWILEVCLQAKCFAGA